MTTKSLLAMLLCFLLSVILFSRNNDVGTLSGAILASAGLLIGGLSKDHKENEDE